VIKISINLIVPFLFLSSFLLFSCNNIDDSKMFSLLPSSQTGIKFKNLIKETSEFNILTYGYLYNGGGVSVGDINNDGLEDIYFTGSMVGSRLYLNKGNFKFEEIAQKAGVFAEGFWNTGTTMADINGDGLLDIYVCRSAAKDSYKRKNLLFINNGDLTFKEQAAEYGIDDEGYSTQGAFFDYDRDGDLDLFVLNHSIQEFASFRSVNSNLKNQRDPSFEDRLYKNENGKFEVVNDEAGLTSNVLGFGLGISISDINNDGWPDIYISNDFNEEDYLYLNMQDGTFKEDLANYIGHTSHFSMGSDIADINNDGFTDIITLDMLPEGNERQKMVSGPDNYDKYLVTAKNGFYEQSMRNMLHLNNKGKSFSEIGQFAGVHATDWSWSALFCDLDNDGFKDLYITNGVKKDYTNMDFMNFAVQEKLNENSTGVPMSIDKLLENIPPSDVENYTYRNNGDLTFSKVNSSWGLDEKSLSNGAAYADLDNDGDLDIIVNNTDSEAFIYRNNSEIYSNNNYLKVELKGKGKNTLGVGAKVIVSTEKMSVTQELMPTRGFQSSVTYDLLFGVGSSEMAEEVKVIWAGGNIQTLKNVKLNQTIILDEANSEKMNFKKLEDKKQFFRDFNLPGLGSYMHKEIAFVDFYQELLLPHKLSTQGPKIAVADVNNDNLEDVFIGGARGQSGTLFIQARNGKFSPLTMFPFILDKNSEDTGVLFFDADGDKDLDLYVVSGGNESESSSLEMQDRLYLNDSKGGFSKSSGLLPNMQTSGSCVRAGDFDADGDLDLFVGARLVPGKYPKSSMSHFLENDGTGRFKDVTTKICNGACNLGMVTDAIWTDFNGDNKLDLIVVGEFMAVKTFENMGDNLKVSFSNNSLKFTEGWWNSIRDGDFDNDGDKDYIIGNFGLNSQLKATKKEPITLYAKDFDNNGSIDPILCSYYNGESYPVFSKDDISNQLNFLKSKYVNYSQYANKRISDIFSSSELKTSIQLKAHILSSVYLENLGDNKFKTHELPAIAQFAPVYSIVVKDFNNDNNLDVLLAGNFFGTRVKYGRYDASRGNLLLGDGKGNFANTDSGLNIFGEVRDLACLRTAAGKNVLLCSMNNARIKLYEFD
jgi:hypothetical protein